jgi:cytochrome c-type biogenesis protein CcmH/NrfG
MRRHLLDVADSIRNSIQEQKRGCTLLIGAGCSVKAGIPTAGEFVDIIREKFPAAYARASKKTYPYVMAELTFRQRYDIIGHYIGSATKLNWAHLAMAQLFKKGYVDRVLTVNFDPLLMRACALVGVFPAVYDFAASQNFNPNLIAPQSVFYLHGQHTGFVLLNTPTEVTRFSRRLKPVFADTVEGRVCVVVGYSGDNDPVFDQLARIKRYDNGLYWICFKETAPQPHVQKQLLKNGKDSFFVQGYDADEFFVTLAQELKCFPPEFVESPFTHLDNLLDLVLPYSLPGRDSGLEAIPKKLLKDAIEKIEKPAKLALSLSNLLLEGKFETVIAMGGDSKELPDEVAELVAWGYVSAGNKLASEAQTKKGEDADKLWFAAGEMYAAALRIDPKKHAAFYNWGSALSTQASTKSGGEANRLWALAAEKYAAALEIKPDKFEALYNWAASLAYQARTQSGDEADKLWALAGEKYNAALKLKPESDDLLYDWGVALATQADTKSGDEAYGLLAEAGKKYQAALKLNPNKHQALNNWARVLTAQAQTKRSGKVNGQLWTSLTYQPKTKSNKEADKLLTLAQEKYAAALEIKPDKFEALYNWAASLVYQARTKSGDEADRLWALAGEKYSAAFAVKPDNYEVLYDWGVALMLQAGTKRGHEADRLWTEAGKKYQAALKLKPNKHQALNNWATVLTAQAKAKTGEEADRLWTLAEEKYKAALKIKSDKHQAHFGLSVVYRSQAETKSGPVAEHLLKQADQELALARAIAPELYPSPN